MCKMCKIILPIKEKYSQNLLLGKKMFELRRTIPKEPVKTIFIYQTAPVSMVVGKLIIKKTHKLPIKQLWKLTSDSNSLSKNQFLEYFKNKKIGYAYEVGTKEKFTKQIPIKKFNFEFAPQSFVYVK